MGKNRWKLWNFAIILFIKFQIHFRASSIYPYPSIRVLGGAVTFALMYDGGGDTAHGPGYGTSPKRLSEIKMFDWNETAEKSNCRESGAAQKFKSSRLLSLCSKAGPSSGFYFEGRNSQKKFLWVAKLEVSKIVFPGFRTRDGNCGEALKNKQLHTFWWPPLKGKLRPGWILIGEY